MNIRTRLLAGIATLLLVPALLGSGAVVYVLHGTLAALDGVVETSRQMHDLLHLQTLTLQTAMPPNDYLIHGNPVERKNFARLSRELDQAFDRELATRLPEDERTQLLESRDEWHKAATIARALLDLPQPIGNSNAAHEMERMDAHIEKATTLLARIHQQLRDEAEQSTAWGQAFKNQTIWLVVSVFIVASIIASLVAIWLARSILLPLHGLETAAVRYGSGDLAYRAKPLADDELGRLANTFNAMAGSLEKERAIIDQRIAQLAALNQVAVTFTSSLHLHDILDDIMRHGIALTNAKAACIAFYDEATERFTNWVTQGLSERFTENMRFRPEGLADETFTTAGPILSNDRPETRHKLSLLARTEGLKCFVCLPLTSRARRLGVLYVYRTDRDTFTPAEIELLTTFASLTAGAIENAQLYAQTQQQARTDTLLGMDNRREFQRRLVEESERAHRHGRPLSLLMFDLDYFKQINDTYGHPAGDDVLRAFAARMRNELRPADRVARYGGEEFSVILPETTADGARVMAERVRHALTDTSIRLPDGREIRLTVSAGVSCYPDDAESPEELVARADQALYAAKEAGRNRVVLYRETLKAGIEKDPGHIVTLLNENLDNIAPLLTALSSKADFYRGHTSAVEWAAARIASTLGIPAADAATLRLAARLHDIGMVTIPDAVLNKTSKLNADEQAAIRRHPAVAAEWLEQVPALKHLAPIVRHHHERYDGGGYPDGLKGEAIPLLARVLAVADSYSAAIADWPGRKAKSAADVKTELRAGAGTQFDPRVVEAALNTLNEPEAATPNHPA